MPTDSTLQAILEAHRRWRDIERRRILAQLQAQEIGYEGTGWETARELAERIEAQCSTQSES